MKKSSQKKKLVQTLNEELKHYRDSLSDVGLLEMPFACLPMLFEQNKHSRDQILFLLVRRSMIFLL